MNPLCKPSGKTACQPLLIGSHVGMSGTSMMDGSVQEALSYGANTFMLYTGAPQNTRRKPVDELCIPQAQERMRQNNITRFVVHAPYIINLANTVKPEVFSLAVEFLAKEIERTEAMGSDVLILHPGSHVGAGTDAGIHQIIEGLNEVLSQPSPVRIALETMAGKGSEIGKRFEELAAIYDGVRFPDRLRVCFDTCHVHDAGYDLTAILISSWMSLTKPSARIRSQFSISTTARTKREPPKTDMPISVSVRSGLHRCTISSIILIF